jgi:HrpA-like RNA helicase
LTFSSPFGDIAKRKHLLSTPMLKLERQLLLAKIEQVRFDSSSTLIQLLGSEIWPSLPDSEKKNENKTPLPSRPFLAPYQERPTHVRLPIDTHAHTITSHIREHRCTIIQGETGEFSSLSLVILVVVGCGKSSRVPELILKDCESRNEVS